MTDPLAAIRALVDRVACAQIEREESRRLILVPTAELAVQVEALAAVLDVGDAIRVQVSPLVPPDEVWVVDAAAMEATWRQVGQRLSRWPRFGGAA